MSENNAIISAPELTPVFSYATVYGVISVYLFKTLNTTIAVMTLNGEAYSVSTINYANVARYLISDAIERFQDENEATPNPFMVLFEDREATRKLNDLLSSIFYGDERGD